MIYLKKLKYTKITVYQIHGVPYSTACNQKEKIALKYIRTLCLIYTIKKKKK